MVRIAAPPPLHTPSPSFHSLLAGSHIIRIFDPTKYETTASTFRFYGPVERFDHHRGSSRQNDPERGIYYAALTFSGCLVEVFGDTGLIEIGQKCVCFPILTRELKLLDIRRSGAMKAGSVAALAKTADRFLSQEWSRYFYDEQEIYPEIDGIIYFNAHNDEEAIALYERAKNGLTYPSGRTLRLEHPSLRPVIQKVALDNNLIFEP